MMYFLQALFGLIGGIFGGMGMGGGTLLIPLLVIFLQMPQTLCQGINLLSFLVMALISLTIHFKNGLIHLNGVWLIVLGGVIFSVLGSYLATQTSTKILKMAFGIFLTILGIYQFIKVIKMNKKGLQK